jgi:chromosome partitioning protein
VITNSERTSLKRLAKPEQYDDAILDMDTPLPNIVQVIIGNDPNLILIPVNASQKYKALKNLKDTFDVIYKLENQAIFAPEVIVL